MESARTCVCMLDGSGTVFGEFWSARNWTLTQFSQSSPRSVIVVISSRPSGSGLCECGDQQISRVKMTGQPGAKGQALWSRTVWAWPWSPFPSWDTLYVTVPQFPHLGSGNNMNHIRESSWGENIVNNLFIISYWQINLKIKLLKNKYCVCKNLKI